MSDKTWAESVRGKLGPITDADLERVQREQKKAIDGGGAWQSWTRILFTLQDLQRDQRQEGGR